MKKASLILAMVALGMFLCTNTAEALTMDSKPILMIDGTGDSDTSVTTVSINNTTGYDFGYLLNGNFSQILAAIEISCLYNFAGGEVYDFAIRSGGTIYSLGSEGSVNHAELDFSVDRDQSLSETPEVTYDYWGQVGISWFDGDLHNPSSNSLGNTSIVALNNDGMAPAASPEPATMLLFGSGLLGLAGLGRKIRRR